MNTEAIPRYLGPRPLPRVRPVMPEHIGIRFLAFRITRGEEELCSFIRALDHHHTAHAAILFHYKQEILALGKAQLVCECVGGGRMNLAGGELDLYDASSVFGPFVPFSQKIESVLREAMTRGELEERKITFWDFHPSRFDKLQRKYSSRCTFVQKPQ